MVVLVGFLRALVLSIAQSILHDEAKRAWRRSMGRESGDPPDHAPSTPAKREWRAQICKAALVTAHSIHDLQRPESQPLSTLDAKRLRTACDRLMADLREHAIGVALETEMIHFETALNRLIEALKDYRQRLTASAPPPSFALLADRFDSLLAAGRRELQKLDS